MSRRRTGVTRRAAPVLAVSLVGLAAALLVAPAARGATEPALFFSVRLEGNGPRVTLNSTATSVNPSPAYTFAKVDSASSLDGSRAVQMKATGATNDPGDLGGAALFTPDSPTRGTADFPGFAEAFFPAFEEVHQTEVAEKCAFNVESREEPACREQPGPYALARVTPEEVRVIGFARQAAAGDSAETRSRAEIFPTEEGAVLGRQVNVGSDYAIPDTPVVVRSFMAAAEVLSTRDGVTGSASCTAEVVVGDTAIVSDEQLQEALGPFTEVTGTHLRFTPPGDPTVEETFGTVAAGCTGAKIVVDPPGEERATYVFGRAFATASPQTDVATSGSGAGVDDLLEGAGGSVPPPSVTAGPSGSTAGTTSSAPPAPQSIEPGPAPTAAGEGVEESEEQAAAPPVESAGAGLIERRIDTLPLAAATAVAGVALPLAVWLLIGVVGSLSRGLPGLRLPPFRD